MGGRVFKKAVVADKHMTGNRAEQYLQLVCELESPAFYDAINVEARGMRRWKKKMQQMCVFISAHLKEVQARSVGGGQGGSVLMFSVHQNSLRSRLVAACWSKAYFPRSRFMTQDERIPIVILWALFHSLSVLHLMLLK